MMVALGSLILTAVNVSFLKQACFITPLEKNLFYCTQLITSEALIAVFLCLITKCSCPYVGRLKELAQLSL